MSPPVPVFLLGARGLLAGEFLRLLEDHPGLALAAAVSREPGPSLRACHPHLAAAAPLLDEAAALPLLARALEAGPAALVLALPHGQAAPAWARIARALGPRADGLVVVDLSADHRLAPEWRYGLPEWRREELQGARRIAAPGCFATAMMLACLPAAEAGLAAPELPWLCHAVTGSSGSGVLPRAGTHHPHRHANLHAYALEGHRHEAEVRPRLGGMDLRLLPASGPHARGIHLVASLPAREGLDPETARQTWRARYAGEPFVEVRTAGVPELRHVAGSNRAALAVHLRDGVLTVLCCLDNLLKGGAGQALQCLNLALGLPETTGLPRAGLGTL